MLLHHTPSTMYTVLYVCRVLRVRLRYQQSNLQQKDSVYVEFASAASADAAIADPPLQLNSATSKLHCQHKNAYEQQQQNLPQTSSRGTSAGKRKQGSSDSVEDATDADSAKRHKKQIAAQKQTISELESKLKEQQQQTTHLKTAVTQVPGLLSRSHVAHYDSAYKLSGSVSTV